MSSLTKVFLLLLAILIRTRDRKTPASLSWSRSTRKWECARPLRTLAAFCLTCTLSSAIRETTMSSTVATQSGRMQSCMKFVKTKTWRAVAVANHISVTGHRPNARSREEHTCTNSSMEILAL